MSDNSFDGQQVSSARFLFEVDGEKIGHFMEVGGLEVEVFLALLGSLAVTADLLGGLQLSRSLRFLLDEGLPERQRKNYGN